MTTLTLEDMFRRLGLPKHSARVYVLLEEGAPLSVSAVADALTVHRPAIYRALRAMEEMDIVVQKEIGKRPFYRAQGRKRIAALFTGAVRDASRIATGPSEGHVTSGTESVRVVNGAGSVTAVFEDLLAHCKRGDVFYRYTSEKNLDEVNRFLPSDYRKRRDAKRLERLVISNRASGTQKRSRLERFVRYLGTDQDPFDQNVIQLIYGDRIAFVDLNLSQAYIIENAAISRFQKTIFRSLYTRL